MGIYSLQEKSHGNFPVWKKLGEEQYLYVHSGITWCIGRDPEGSSCMILQTATNPIPKSPVNGAVWAYFDTKDLSWKKDDTFKVEVFTMHGEH